MRVPRVIGLLATYNEERFVEACLEHLFGQGVEVYLIDNQSTDRTVALAEPYLGRGLIAIEELPRRGRFSLASILERKEQLAGELEADWFLHQDADEFRVAMGGRERLVDALAEADSTGYNAVNFLEFTFVPTVEAPDHDHPRFQQTMRHYYPFLPEFPHRLNAWKRQREAVTLRNSAGHRVQFAGLRMSPRSLAMRHYLFLSPDQARRKYEGRIRSDEEDRLGWGGWRNLLACSGSLGRPCLPRQAELREYLGDGALDPTEPLLEHTWAVRWAEQATQRIVGKSRARPNPRVRDQ
jgi:glycosyltransferase involved in cell wall biosynthesis